MGFSIGIIAIKGLYVHKANRLFNALGYEGPVETKIYKTWNETAQYLDGNYLEYAKRDVSLWAIWEDREWTMICEPEITDLWEDEKLSHLAGSLGVEIWTLVMENTSGSFSFAKFDPGKVRLFYVSDGKVIENEGAPLPEELGLNVNEKISATDILSLGDRLGFKVEPETMGNFVVYHLPYGKEMKAELDQYLSRQESEPLRPGKPWWKIW